ncbi:MAG: methyltransferase domain-containing protein [Candidatus Aenigmatarchaeota archaeon]
MKERFIPFGEQQLKRYEIINRYLKGKIVLNVGSSWGNFNKYLKSTNRLRTIVGVDVCGNPDIEHDLNVFPYPIKDKNFDTVVAGDIIEHLLHPHSFFHECHRILKPGGRLILTTSNATSLYYIMNPNTCGFGKNPHVYAWTIPMLEKHIEKAGFRVIDSGLITCHWNLNILARMLCALVPNLKTEIIMVCEK